jgi:CHAT domain-containing protein/tetratricopeptide (TPR) repeat protein
MTASMVMKANPSERHFVLYQGCNAERWAAANLKHRFRVLASSNHANPVRQRWFHSHRRIRLLMPRCAILLFLFTVLFCGVVLGAEPLLAARPPLPVGKVVEDAIAPGETPYYPLQLDAGTFLRIKTVARDVIVSLRLVGPDGKVLHLSRHPADLRWVSDSAGSYRIEAVGSAGQTVRLRYAIMVNEVRPTEPLDEKRLTAQRLHDEGTSKINGSEAQKREAIGTFERERALWQELGEGGDEASALIGMANVEYLLGELERASAHLDEARSIALQAGHREREATAIADQTRVLTATGHLQDSIDGKLRALEIYREIGDRRSENQLLSNLAANYVQLGDYERALDLLDPALRFFRETRSGRFESNALATSATCRMILGQLPQALESAQDALAVARRERIVHLEAQAFDALGGVHLKMGHLQEAIAVTRMAVSVWHQDGNRRSEARSRAVLGKMLERVGQAGQARDLLEQAVLELRAVGDRYSESFALVELARAERALGEMASAQKHIDAAIEMEQGRRRELLRDDWRTLFGSKRNSDELAVDLRMAMQRASPGRGLDVEALTWSERARARTLVELLSRGGVDPGQGADPEFVKRRRDIESELKAQGERQLRLIAGQHTREQVRAGEAEAERLTEQLREAQARIWATAGINVWRQSQTVTGAEIGERLLDSETTLLEYWLGSEHSYAWVVTSSAVKSYELPPEGKIEKLARRAYGEMQSRRGGSDASRALARMVLQPMAKELGGRCLIIVADGALQYIPFGALPLPNGAPVISKYEVVNLPSASALAIVRREREGRAPAPKLAAVLADPAYTKDDPRVTGARAAMAPRAELVRSVKESGLVELNRLPATQVEAEILRKFAGDKEVLEAVGFEANRDTVLGGALGEYRILHFATHALVNSLHPELSGLVLSLVDSEGKPRDGFLQAHEIYGLKLRADLAVLSACRTALGKEIRGEGLMSLTRAFMAAGVPRVVASLWSVPDAATAELMTRFYRGVMTDGLAPAAALRKAQDSLRKDKRWLAPYFWAGFTLLGEWK